MLSNRLLIGAGITLLGCGSDGSNVTPPEEPGPTYLQAENANLTITGAALMPSPIAVRVVNLRFRGIANVPVRWSLSDFNATFHDSDGRLLEDPVTLTNEDGYAHVRLRPDSTGEGTVTAHADGQIGSPLTFSVTVHHPLDVFVIFSPFMDCNETSFFYAGGRVNEVDVKLGGTVHFRYADSWLGDVCRAIVASTEMPTGGSSFLSDSLKPTQTFSFKPNVVGTWVFVDRVNGGGGTLTVRQ